MKNKYFDINLKFTKKVIQRNLKLLNDDKVNVDVNTKRLKGKFIKLNAEFDTKILK